MRIQWKCLANKEMRGNECGGDQNYSRAAQLNVYPIRRSHYPFG
jgi:hypothetical protein